MGEYKIEPPRTRDDLYRIVDIHRGAFYTTYVNEEFGVTKDVVDTFMVRTNFVNRKVKFWEQRLQPSSNWLTLVARFGSAVVGFGAASTDTDEIKGCVEAIYIHPIFQRRGIGSLVLAGLDEQLLEGRSADLLVSSYTQPARKFYSYHNFEDGEPRPDIKLYDDYSLQLMSMRRSDQILAC